MDYKSKYLKYKKKYLFIKNSNRKKIIFNPDGEQIGGVISKEEKIRIIELYNQLSSGPIGLTGPGGSIGLTGPGGSIGLTGPGGQIGLTGPIGLTGDGNINYDELSTNILEIIRKSTHEDIDLLEYPLEQKIKMHEDIELIYRSISKTEINYIGKVNIVSLQFIMVFTENCCDTSKPFKVNLNNIYNDYNEFKSINWKNYDLIKSKIINNRTFKCLYYADNNIEYSPTNLNGQIYLITPIKYFTLDEIIISFLNNKILCGISSNFSWADGRYLTPFEFLEHDITHGNNFNFACFNRIRHSIDDLKSFYNYCITTISDRINLYAAKLIIFLLIHETLCDFFSTDPNHYLITKENILSSITEYGSYNPKRFLDPNDLFEALPKRIRDEYTTTKDSKVISDYLDRISDIYREELLNWIQYKNKHSSPLLKS